MKQKKSHNKKKPKVTVTADQIKNFLDERHAKPDQSLIAFEVADGTGMNANRWADAVAMELWPSNKYAITGYEIKVTRTDWLKELRMPEKSQPIVQFCDYFYLVAPDGVLKPDELPKNWGWICATDKSLRIKIRAKKRDAVQPDKPFIASLLRKCISKYQDAGLLEKIKEQITTDQRDYWKKQNLEMISRANKDAVEYKL